MFSTKWICAVLLTLIAVTLSAGEKKVHKASLMDYGPFISCTAGAGLNNVSLKGIIVKLEKEKPASICFDTELLRVSAGWTGGYIDWAGTAFNESHGVGPNAVGNFQFATTRNPGWSKDGKFEDPRKEKDGPLPADWAKYKGLFLNGEKVIFSYSVGDCNVLEMQSALVQGDAVGFTRHFTLSASSKAASMAVCENEKGTGSVIPEKTAASLTIGGDQIHVGLMGAPAGAELEVVGGRINLKLPLLKAPASFKLVMSKLPVADAAKFAPFLVGTPENLEALTKGGAARWTQTINTKGVLGAGDGPYVVDTFTAPDDNPWKSWIRFGGMDLFKDGKRAALSTWSGDVWVVSGIDDKLENLSWKRYATGLFQPLGLKIVDDIVYTLGRDQITRLHDLNNDGEADFYENFNNDCTVTTNFHEFAFDLQTDPEGNFYYSKGAPVRGGGRKFERISEHNGCLMKVSKDGKKSEVFATGVRAPNGIGVGPNGEVTSGDNQGTWVPVCPLNWIKKGSYLGVKDAAHKDAVPEDREPPMLWFPMNVDRSGGGQVWVTSDKWGPFKGDLLHLSYGMCSIFKIMPEFINGTPQGAAVRFPLNFQSGIMRARFNAVDGQLYVAGLKGWQTSAARDGCFQRVRYTGKPVHLPKEFHVTKGQISVTFTEKLDEASVNDVANWGGEWFNVSYFESGNPGVDNDPYGSPEFNVSDPKKKGREPLPIKGVKLSGDGKTVSLAIPDLKPVTNIVIKYKLKAADGTAVTNEIYNTINVIP